MKYDFSVVIPYYNKAFELNLILKGLTKQDYDPDKFEVVIVDDGSENRIDDLVKKYSDTLHLRYVYLEHTANRGHNRNQGVKASLGKRIIFLDGDVIPAQDLISAFQAATRNKPKHVSIGFINYLLDFDRKLFDGAAIEHNFEMVWRMPANLDSRLLTVDYEKRTGHKMEGKWQLLYTNCVCIPKKEFEAVDGFDEVFSKNWGAEDVELGFRLYQKGCTIDMNEAVRGYHIYHAENWSDRTESMQKNYDIFLQMHNHWAVELFTKEYKTFAPKMIEIQNEIKKRGFIVSDLQNLNRLIAQLPDQVLICGIENGKLIQSDKVEKAFIPESKLKSPKIINWIGINTEYPDHSFKLALLSKKYEAVNYGLFQMLYAEIQRIAKEVILVDEQTDILSLMSLPKSIPPKSRKQIIFLVSPTENYSIHKHFMNLAIALHQKGVKTGYSGYHDTDPNRGVMRTVNPEKIQIIQKLINHDLEFIEDSIPAIIDMTILKGTTRCLGPRILWEEVKFYHQEKDMVSDLVGHVTTICPRRPGDQGFYPDSKPVKYLPVGIDKQKIAGIQAGGRLKNRRFTILWADHYTNSFSHLGLILESFCQLFKDQEDIELKIVHPGNNTIFTSYHRSYRHQLYDQYYLRLYNQYRGVTNIHFHQAELSDEEYSREIFQCDCFIHLNSQMKLNSWVLESVAFGKKPIILDNRNYEGYFSAQECFKVKTYQEAAFNGKLPTETLRLEAKDPRRTYLVDMPIQESLLEILERVYQNQDSVFIPEHIAHDFRDRYDWLVIADQLEKMI